MAIIHPYLQKKQVSDFGIRIKGNWLVIPLKDANDKLWSLQFIDAEGNKRFLTDGKKKGCFYPIGLLQETETAFVCEGFATGASIYQATKIPTVVAFDAGNLEPVVANIRSAYPHMKITLCADNDQGKERNTGKEAAEKVAAKYGCKVILPEFAATTNNASQPTDFNDLHVLQGLEEVEAQLQRAAVEANNILLPPGFSLNKEGLYFEEQWVSSPIEVLAYTRDENSKNWGRLIRFQDSDGCIHQYAIPMELLSGDCCELYGLLLSSGLRLTSKKSIRNKLIDYLQGIELDRRALCASRIGWHDNHFILPDGAIPETDTLYLQSDNTNLEGFSTAGFLQEWQKHVAVPCQNNSRLVFSLCCAFAAPFFSLVHAESGGFNLKGASSIGKTTALSVAASVWGSPKYIKQWKTTGNALEAIAEAHNNTLLCLDELSQVDGREAGEIAYMIANGSGKNRLKAKGGLRKSSEWNLLFLSTGEISIADKISEAGKKAQAGMLARMSDIPADAGKGHRLFDTIHNFKDGSALAHHLKDSTSKYYGTAIRAFLPHLLRIKDQLPQILAEIKKDFFECYMPEGVDGQVQRVASRFILVAAAGELAIKVGILPYKTHEAFEAIGKCFQAWLEERGSVGAYEIEEGIRQVQAFLEAHHSKRFALMKGEAPTMQEEKISNQAGYKQKTKEGSYEFFVFTDTFRKEICKGFDSRAICAALASRGMLIRGNDRQFIKQQRLPIGRLRIYHLTSAILTEAEQ
jgi:putative DNA primase/helicase